MTKFVFDTSAYSQLLRGHIRVAQILRTAEQIFVPNVVMAELEYGFELGSKKAENQKLLARFVASNKVKVLLPDNFTSTYFVNIAVYAHKKRVKLSSHDLWIASLTQQWDAKLVTFDRDFTHIDYPGLDLLYLQLK